MLADIGGLEVLIGSLLGGPILEAFGRFLSGLVLALSSSICIPSKPF